MTPLEEDPAKGLNGATAAELRAEKAAQKISFDDLADRTNMSRRTLIRVFNGERHITSAYMETICEELAVRPSEIYAKAERRLAAEPSSNVVRLPRMETLTGGADSIAALTSDYDPDLETT